MVIHRDTSPQILIYFLPVPTFVLPNCLKDLCVKMPSFRVRKFFLFPSLLFLSAGASHARLPTSPQAQQVLLVLTMPAPQGSRVASWVPHFSKGIPATAVGLPQECFLTTASVTGTNREQERKSGKGNIVIKSEDMEVSHAAAPTTWKAYSCLPETTFAKSWMNTTPGAQEAFKLCRICNITPLETSDELKPSNNCCHRSTLRLRVKTACFPLIRSYVTRVWVLAAAGRVDTIRTELLATWVSMRVLEGMQACARTVSGVWVRVYTRNQMDSSRSNEDREGDIVPLRSSV